jgi:Uma2 family endonuclease
MAVLIREPLPTSISAFLEERRRTGADRFDEMWEGVLHVAPAPTGAHDDLLAQVIELIGPPARAAGLVPGAGGFNLGDANDYRIPDGGIRRERSAAVYFETAALVVEIVSPNDETFAKLPFYADHAVDEVLIIDPADRTVRWLGRDDSGYRELTQSAVVPLGPAQLAAAIDWPPPAD